MRVNNTDLAVICQVDQKLTKLFIEHLLLKFLAHINADWTSVLVKLYRNVHSAGRSPGQHK